MSKTNGRRSKDPCLLRYERLSPLARQLGVPTSTLDSAVRAGHVESGTLAYGTVVISVASAKRWAASERRPGPKVSQ